MIVCQGASVTGFWTRIDDEIGTMSVGTWPNSYTTYTNYSPVSYTHLDVYKRQVQAARDGYPAGTADNAADQGGEEQGCRPCQAARKPPHHQANQR